MEFWDLRWSWNGKIKSQNNWQSLQLLTRIGQFQRKEVLHGKMGKHSSMRFLSGNLSRFNQKFTNRPSEIATKWLICLQWERNVDSGRAAWQQWGERRSVIASVSVVTIREFKKKLRVFVKPEQGELFCMLRLQNRRKLQSTPLPSKRLLH